MDYLSIQQFEQWHGVKSIEETKHIPVIFITVKGHEADIERGFAVRADNPEARSGPRIP